MARKVEKIVGYSEPFIADVSFRTMACGSDNYLLHVLGMRDDSRMVYVGCLVSMAKKEMVDVVEI